MGWDLGYSRTEIRGSASAPHPAWTSRLDWRSYNWGVKLPADKKKRLAQYRKTVEALEQVRARELANMTDEEALRRIESLQCAGEPWRARPDWSGLIELQAIFHRRKKKK